MTNALLIAGQAIVLLVGAASLKVFGSQDVLSIGLSTAELLVAALILRWRRQPRGLLIIAGAFSIFALVAGWKWLSGASSCGCFGIVVAVPPALTFVVDLLVAMAALSHVLGADRWVKVMAPFSTVSVILLIGLVTFNPLDARSRDATTLSPFAIIEGAHVIEARDRGPSMLIVASQSCASCRALLENVDLSDVAVFFIEPETTVDTINPAVLSTAAWIGVSKDKSLEGPFPRVFAMHHATSTWKEIPTHDVTLWAAGNAAE